MVHIGYIHMHSKYHTCSLRVSVYKLLNFTWLLIVFFFKTYHNFLDKFASFQAATGFTSVYYIMKIILKDMKLVLQVINHKVYFG